MIASKIRAIWATALNLEEFSDSDNFFSLGGNSLSMTKVQRDIQSKIGITVPMDLLFRKATVTSISMHIIEILPTE
ncbi:acyl carrier protein [Streptomyces sp. LaPpAH-108]|uniref:acyl carrier protein n=1 Tax=Streptomyces sp. LaPpAH-108 TaxID=1155714 RepID=UPI00131A328F|nr:acyl carrier protein [Streptomyces sp. LaPpAH-108]